MHYAVYTREYAIIYYEILEYTIRSVFIIYYNLLWYTVIGPYHTETLTANPHDDGEKQPDSKTLNTNPPWQVILGRQKIYDVL